VADKFRECAAFSRWPSDKAEQLVDLVSKLEELEDVARLNNLLSEN
jgi:hypothetical protein